MTTTEPTPEAVEELARVIDPEAFDHDRPKLDHPAALVQWAARRHMATEDARNVLAAGYVPTKKWERELWEAAGLDPSDPETAAVMALAEAEANERHRADKAEATIARIKERIEEESPCLDRYLGAESCDHPGCVLERDLLKVIDPESGS